MKYPLNSDMDDAALAAEIQRLETAEHAAGRLLSAALVWRAARVDDRDAADGVAAALDEWRAVRAERVPQ